MVRSDDEGAVVLGGAGATGSPTTRSTGETRSRRSTTPRPTTCAATTAFRHCPDILVNGIYDPEADEVAPFEEFMGSHGGLGGTQMHPFAVVPGEWSEPEGPIVGVGAMHQSCAAGWRRPGSRSPSTRRD